MADGSQATGGGAPGDAQASALALLAESSATRPTKGEEMTTQTEMERVRVKLENARGRMGASLADIPTGREYDSVPDASDEPVYDALEKTYNAAFLVHPPAEADHEGKEETLVRHEEKLGSESSEKGTGPGADGMDKSGNKDENATLAGTLKSMQEHAGIEDQSVKKDAGEKDNVAVKKDEASSPNRKAERPTTSSADVRYKGDHSTGDVEERSKTLASLLAESAVTTASPLQSPLSPANRTSSEDGFLSTPEGKKEVCDISMNPEIIEEAKIERTDNLSLNEFLISELEVYCSRLLEKRFPKIGSSDVSDLARITGLQLYQDHQRALMNFDDEWKRSHADNYRRYTSVPSVNAPGAPAAINTNPFQQSTVNLGDWTTLLNQVRASSTKSTPAGVSPEVKVRQGIEDLFSSYKRGSNGIIIGGDNCDEERSQVSALMAQIASSQNTSAFYVVVAAGSDLGQWEKALSSEELIQLYPYWGNKEDRQNLLQLLSNEYFSGRNLSAYVLLSSYEVFMEDISVVTSLQCQLSIIDIPRQATDHIAAIWPQLLSLRCRQRLLLCQSSFEIDVRKLLHFLVPELFSSRRKLLAWNSAALHTDQICAASAVVRAFTRSSNEEASTVFMSKVESCTKRNSESEMAALDLLNKQGIVRAIKPSIMVPVKRVLNKKSRARGSKHIPAKGKIEAQNAPFDPVDPQLTIKAPNILPKKRRVVGGDGTPGSRQRIGRCGKCAGCLTEDCMKCGHCQDMKKYGGPGLRKQSCKRRKCSNPKIWGLATRKRKRKTKPASDLASVKKGDAELDDDASVAYSSVESDGESVSTATFGNGDSDDDSLRYSDAAVDSPRDLLLPASDTLLEDNLSLSDLSSRSASARSRVVRCGECDGCHAPDCMKCPHCLDMKKYGGPGLRKQTCKNRKCNAPKVVALNQTKGGHDQYVDEKGNVVYSGLNDGSFPGFYEAPDTTTVSPRVSGALSVTQECERYVKSRQIFACVDCVARFSSSKVLKFHEQVEHSVSTGQGKLTPTAFEREASRLFARPIYQNAMLSAQLKKQARQPDSSPLGYAKLEGQDFHYFFIEPFVVLGRMESRWCNLYKDLGFANLKGLTSGNVDCHVGNDSMIATKHAVISRDARLGSFVIECLSLRTPISVNGRELSFSSPPMALSSRSLVQIGASVFYFLLPKATKASSSTIEGNASTPRA